MLRRIFAFNLLAWALGFAWFALVLPQPAGDTRTDAVVVLTGGAGRIERGLDVLERGWADRMLISGVDPEVKPEELAAEYDIPADLLQCCIALGYDAVDTRSNADEAAMWADAQGYRTLRLVTSDWHMRRALFDVKQTLDPGMTVLVDAVPTEPSMFMLFLEYHKFVARHVADWTGLI
ncbi:YdcF family protein [Croceicoccus hydrothermalis]|uniref:YdcF family protein n=1 Tax=Croceicoccus hydrothermalis TaxID=2867964 RepID=UPI001EFB370D|nr:YdcF family protein [Croceicoccus hydrothermalis]